MNKNNQKKFAQEWRGTYTTKHKHILLQQIKSRDVKRQVNGANLEKKINISHRFFLWIIY